ncbi:Aspartyl protease protein 2 [Stylosanthes scabra]|uniref:Aspartyl protease protein 2 n=1 Tax=Stylosanthes scabra TaxID=79078 RepID=A0ABU6W2S0_9FABA|nr:Aspartyl protease protein 2 [Stylosanthes scabra]
MEEPKPNNKVLLSFLAFFLSLSAAAATSNFQTQTLAVNTLPHPPTLSWPESEPESLSDFDPTESELESAAALSLQLHHIDALSSNTTPHQLFNLRLQRDAARVHALTSIAAATNQTRVRSPGSRPGFSSSVISGLTQGSGEYFTRLGVGTPARYVYMVLDTGSDVVWLQCAPCRKCYSETDPVFDPSKSRTFAKIPCGAPLCRRLDSPGCNRNKVCQYQVSYGDGSFTFGDFSTETLTLSFPAQTGRRFNQKFSYCLVDRSASSKPSSIVFGDAAVSRTARFTPLLKNPKLDTFYYVELIGISVGGSPVRGVSASLFRIDATGNGGVIIDSGTSVTRLTRPAYIALRDAYRAGASHLKRAPEFSLFDTCYDLSGQTSVQVPKVVLHFRGADVSLPASNYMIPVDNSGSFCFAFAGTLSGLSIIGNIQQQGFRVVYDLAGSRVGFAERGCQ